MLFPQKIDVVASVRHANPHNETVVVQNDTAVEFYVAVVGDNGQTELPEGATYTLVCLHLRKEPTEKLGTLQEDGNVMFKLTHMELSETGPVQAQVRVYHPEGGRLTSNPFIFHVAPDPTYGAEIKPEDQSIIEQVIGEGPGIIAEAKEETEKNITERARLTGAVGGALNSLAQDKAEALLEMSQSKTAADESAQTALQAADNADQERDRLTQEVSDKITEVETARIATVEATGEALSAADLATQEADAARLQKEEVADILGAGPVASVNGKTGVVDGLATQESMDQVTAQLADTLLKTDTGVLNLNVFDESTRAAIQGMAEGEINAVLGLRNVKPENASFFTKGKNLYNMATDTKDSAINQNTGAVYSLVNSHASDFIEVEPLTEYSAPTFGRVGFYDSTKKFISGFNYPSSTKLISTPENARFVRLTILSQNRSSYIFSKGNQVLRHEPYKEKMDSKYLPAFSELSGTLLLAEAIENTRQKPYFSNGVITKVEHISREDSSVIRTDSYSFATANKIIETRIDKNGDSITFTTDLTTLETEVV